MSVRAFFQWSTKRKSQHKKKKKKTCASRWIHKQACTRDLYTLDTRHSKGNNTTAFNIDLQRSILFESQTNKKKKHNACKHSIVPLERAMAKLVHDRDSNGKMHAQFTIDQYFWSGYQLAQAAPVTKNMMKKTKTHHHNGTRAGQYLLLQERPTRRNTSCSATTITNDAYCIHHFCSGDQLAEARNAITCDDKN
jgi:hypothetical protein